MAIISLVLVLTWPVSGLVRAQVGPNGPVGPTEPVGPQMMVGPTEPVGTVGQIGPTAEVQTLPETVVTTANTATGPASDNSNQVSTQSTQAETVHQTADVTNQTTVQATTGNNTVQKNGVVQAVQTGAINGSMTIVNAANSLVAPGSSAGSQTVNGSTGSLTLTRPETRTAIAANNNLTGPDSQNSNAVDQTAATTVLHDQNAVINNQVDVQAVTGQNDVVQNTYVGGLRTGDVGLGVQLVNVANLVRPDLQLEVNTWSVQGGVQGDIIVPESVNRQTGPDSSNLNVTNTSSAKQVEVTQSATVNNGITVDANTGNNTVQQNSAVGQVESGQTTVDARTTNVVNSDVPFFYIVNVFGTWDGDTTLFGLPANSFVVNELGNMITGPGSTNENSSQVNNQQSSVLNQQATVKNLVHVTADTGHNSVLKNTQVGAITTGNIRVMTNAVNLLNLLSQKSGKFMLGIINIFGDWKKPVPPLTGVGGGTEPLPIPLPAVGNTSTGTQSNGGVGGPSGSVGRQVVARRLSAPTTSRQLAAATATVQSAPRLLVLPSTGVQTTGYAGLATLLALVSMMGTIGWMRVRRV